MLLKGDNACSFSEEITGILGPLVVSFLPVSSLSSCMRFLLHHTCHVSPPYSIDRYTFSVSLHCNLNTWFSVNTHILTGMVSSLNAQSLDWFFLTDVYFDIRMSLLESSGTI